MTDLNTNIEEQNPENGENGNKYEIHIDNFTGPLDVLWDLIKKSKIDITEVPLSNITEQYIEFLKLLDKMNIKVAIEFVWMASELLYYKSRSLLPSDKLEDEYFTPPLPPELIKRLLEFKKYQKSSNLLKEMYDSTSDSFARSSGHDELGEEEVYLEVSLFDLLKAFANVLESQSTVEHEEIVFDEILVSDRISYITDLLKEKEMIVFTEIFSARPGRAEVIASFLAVLEMTKMKIIKIFQHRVFGEIRIARNFIVENLV